MTRETMAPTRPTLPGGIDPLQLVPPREFDRLVLLLTHAERGAWAFCLYNTATVRDAIVEALRVRLDPLPVYEFTLSPQQPNPRNYLRRLPAGAADKRAIIIFYDAWRAFDSGFFGYLDLQREQFMKVPHSFVFWVQDADRAAIARYAPNFYSRHAGVFDFQVVVPEQALAWRELSAALPVSWDSVEERERQERLYVNLLTEYEADEESDQAAIADLLGKLAGIWYHSARYEQAEEALERRLTIVRNLDDRAGEADSLYLLGWAAVRGYDMDQALATYEQALQLFRAVGDRPGEANTLGAMSRLALQQGQDEEAGRLLQQAVEQHAALGSTYDVAVDLGNFGLVLRSMGRLEEARKYLLQAAEVFAHISLPHLATQMRQAAGEGRDNE